jgi:hypothetical protein
VANSFVVRLRCPYGDEDGRLVLKDREETLIQILATPWDFECPVHGVQRALPLEAREEPRSSTHLVTQTGHLSPTARIFLGLAAAVAVSAIALSGLMLFRRHSRQAQLAQSEKPGKAAQVGGASEVANVRELAEPWSSKFFIFHRPETKGNISSIVVRLPDGAPDQPGSYWAFSLQPLFGSCQLEYITDLQRLSSDYKYAAKHPMVGDPCSRAVFDPLQMADLPGGAWARGAIVRGYAFRPPLAIEIRINSDQLVAAAME